MSDTWRGREFDIFLWHRSLSLKNRKAITEVEIIQDSTLQVRFQGAFGQTIVTLPERPDDRIGCDKRAIILVRIRGIYIGEGGGSGMRMGD